MQEKFSKFSEYNLKFREFLFLVLAFSIPTSAAGISISLILIFILWLIDGGYGEKIKELIENPFFLTILLFAFTNFFGQFWLEVEGVDGHKNWILFLIPVLATSVGNNTKTNALFIFLLSMLMVEIGVYYNIISSWSNFLDLNSKSHHDVFWTVSHITYSPFLVFAISISIIGIINKQFKGLRLYLVIFFTTTMVVNLFIIGGRTGQLTFIFSWLFLSVYFFKDKIGDLIKMLISLFLIISIAFAFSPVFQSRTIQTFKDLASYINQRSNDSQIEINSVSDRLTYYENSYKLFLQSPFFGHGTGSFKNSYNTFSKNSPTNKRETSNPHNSHLIVLVQFGIVGFIVYLSIFLSQIHLFRKSARENPYRPLMLLTPFFFFFISFYDSYMWGHHSQALFAFISAILYRQNH